MFKTSEVYEYEMGTEIRFHIRILLFFISHGLLFFLFKTAVDDTII